MLTPKFLLLYFCSTIACAHCKIIPIIFETIHNCAEGNKPAGLMDHSGLEIVAEDDTHSFLNGKVLFPKGISSPWQVHIRTEQFDRNEWNMRGIDATIPDLCGELHEEDAPWYDIFKDKAACPMPAETAWNFENVDLSTINFEFPKDYVGKWRVDLSTEVQDGVNKLVDCFRIYFDLADI
jgi:hypothetical protein